MKEPSEMTALELREAVAVEVMGRKKHSWPWLPGEQAVFPRCAYCGETCYFHEPEKQAGWCWGFNPSAYESDIAAAFDVVEKMREKGFRLSLLAWNRDDAEDVVAEFERWAEKGRSKAFGEGQHESAPRAICMAAVDAVRAAKENA